MSGGYNGKGGNGRRERGGKILEGQESREEREVKRKEATGNRRKRKGEER